MARVHQWRRGFGLMRPWLFFGLAILLSASVGEAQSGKRSTSPCLLADEALFPKAAAVLVVHVLRVEEVGIERTSASSPPTVTVEATFRVEEALKGTPPADNKVRFQKPIQAGLDYLLLLDSGHAILHADVPEWCNAAPRLILRAPDGKIDSMSQRLLEKLRELAKNE